MLVVFAVLMMMFRPPPPNMLALLGILLAIGGSGWLYWEPILTEEEVAEFVRMMMNVDRSQSLDAGERNSILLMSSPLIFFVGAAGWIAFQSGWSSPSLTLLAGATAVCAVLGVGFYSFIKLQRALAVKRAIVAASLETHEERVLFVRAKMRTWGFACLLAGGALQIPLILVF